MNSHSSSFLPAEDVASCMRVSRKQGGIYHNRSTHSLWPWQGIGDSAFVGQSQAYPFSTVVFTSWDHHLTDVRAARNLRNSVRNQLAEMLYDAALADAYVTRTQRVGGILLKVRSQPCQSGLLPGRIILAAVALRLRHALMSQA